MVALGALLAALDTLVLERRPDGCLAVCEAPPPWLHHLLGLDAGDRPRTLTIRQISPFLEAFLPEAERVWAGDGPARADSGPWTETIPGGGELHLEATAVRVSAAPLLVITRNDALFFERRRVLQRARELRLAHDALAAEIERKDVLIHCIVHDLASPLNSILGALSLLEERPPEGKAMELVTVALKAALRQRALIREILETFAAERSALDDVTAAPELRAAAAQVVDALSPVAASRGVRLAGPSPTGPPCEVIGEERRLFRVLSNLVENAIRFTPAGGSVRVALHDDPGGARVTVEDEGPGVPPDLVSRLFQKLSRGYDPASGIGLGLYFCRITVEGWGGAIGYEARPEGGARFWFRLRRAAAGGATNEGSGQGRSDHGEAAARG
ncbi:MAG: HAMP domain-containing histidine kinase [Polyangiaceae bacterium]|nr:HAMP domain-containing histidine kinase [Polyangiaceae bacterium]